MCLYVCLSAYGFICLSVTFCQTTSPTHIMPSIRTDRRNVVLATSKERKSKISEEEKLCEQCIPPHTTKIL